MRPAQAAITILQQQQRHAKAAEAFVLRICSGELADQECPQPSLLAHHGPPPPPIPMQQQPESVPAGSVSMVLLAGGVGKRMGVSVPLTPLLSQWRRMRRERRPPPRSPPAPPAKRPTFPPCRPPSPSNTWSCRVSPLRPTAYAPLPPCPPSERWWWSASPSGGAPAALTSRCTYLRRSLPCCRSLPGSSSWPAALQLTSSSPSFTIYAHLQ